MYYIWYMKFFDRIEKLRQKYSLGVLDFIDKSRISQTSYYSLRDGKTTAVSQKTLNKIIEAFPEDKDFITNDSYKLPNISNLIGEPSELDRLVVEIVEREDDLMQHTTFKLWLETKVQDAIIKRYERERGK